MTELFISNDLWKQLVDRDDDRLDVIQSVLSRWNIKDVQFKVFHDYHINDKTFWLVERWNNETSQDVIQKN